MCNPITLYKVPYFYIFNLNSRNSYQLMVSYVVINLYSPYILAPQPPLYFYTHCSTCPSSYSYTKNTIDKYLPSIIILIFKLYKFLIFLIIIAYISFYKTVFQVISYEQLLKTLLYLFSGFIILQSHFLLDVCKCYLNHIIVKIINGNLQEIWLIYRIFFQLNARERLDKNRVKNIKGFSAKIVMRLIRYHINLIILKSKKWECLQHNI